MGKIKNPAEHIRQSTFFWGCVGLASAVVLTVFGTMMHDTRWLLFLAWPSICLAAWEFSRTYSNSKYVISSITVISAIISSLLLSCLYIGLAPESSEPPQSDAIVEIVPLPVKKLLDGKYAFPIAINNVGSTPIFNYQATFGMAFNPKILSLDEEDDLFYRKSIIQILDTVSNFIKENNGVSIMLRPNRPHVKYIPQFEITESQMEDVNSGKMNAYYFFIVAYQDSPHGPFYFAQYCGRLAPKLSALARCWHENFTKRAHL